MFLGAVRLIWGCIQGDIMDGEGQEKWGVVKTAAVFLGCFAVAAAYYIFLNWVMMVHAQNLPFPYR